MGGGEGGGGRGVSGDPPAPAHPSVPPHHPRTAARLIVVPQMSASGWRLAVVPTPPPPPAPPPVVDVTPPAAAPAIPVSYRARGAEKQQVQQARELPPPSRCRLTDVAPGRLVGVPGVTPETPLTGTRPPSPSRLTASLMLQRRLWHNSAVCAASDANPRLWLTSEEGKTGYRRDGETEQICMRAIITRYI